MSNERSRASLIEGASKRLCGVALPSFKDFDDDLQGAAEHVIPSPQPIFSKAVIVTIGFEDTDFDLATTRNRLVNVLINDYNFDHIPLTLEAFRPEVAVKDYIARNFRRIERDYQFFDHRLGLVVVYYSGHAELSYGGSNLIIRGHDPGSCRTMCIHWRDVSGHGNRSGIRYLRIIDTCHVKTADLRSTVETLAACAWEDAAPEQSNTSFTNFIAMELENAKGANINASHLLSKVIHRYNAKGIHAQPIHRRGSCGSSIVFHKIGTIGKGSQLGIAPICPRASVKIKFTVAKNASVPNVEDWRRYITEKLPEGVSEVSIVTSWVSSSVSVVVRMPAEVYFWFPIEQPEYTLLGLAIYPG